jgi:tetratricopeptide (TPR) repeat protein
MVVDINKQRDRAQRFLEKNRYEDAIQVYQSILSEVPGHLDSLQALGDLYTRLGQADRAATHYGLLFDRLFDGREENKALAIYSRTLRGIQQPPERMARYALLLQKQNRAEEAIEQFTLASELFLARGKEEAALDCLERVAQLDPENATRQSAVGVLAERLSKTALASRAYLRAGQLSEGAGDAEAALGLLARAHELAPEERSPALLYAQALVRRGDAAAAAQLLEPFSGQEMDPGFLTTQGEALMRSGALDRAATIFEGLLAENPAIAGRLFELAAAYMTVQQEAQAVALLRRVQRRMVAARQESEFGSQLDALVDWFPNSIPLVEFWASAYAEMNRETKYFDALGRLFDLYLAAGKLAGACEVLDRLVEIDPYDSRNQQRIDSLQGRGDASHLARIRSRLSQVATHSAPISAPAPRSTPVRADSDVAAGGPQALEDLIVQAEIFLQYSLQAKAIERLQKIAAMFPEETGSNERLRRLFQLANWWPEGVAPPTPPAAQAAAASEPGRETAADSADTIRDLAKISEISQSLLRLTSPRAILSAAINEMGNYLRATRCLAVVGAPGRAPQMASEFCASGNEPAPAALLVRLLGQLEHAVPDALGGLTLDAGSAPVLRELGLETVLAVALADRETRTQAGMAIAGYAAPHVWRPSETYFLQAVGDQMLLGVNHTRLRTLARTLGAADEKTGLLARSSYQDCLLGETLRAKSQGTTLSLALLQIDRGAELLRQHGEAQLERHMEQLARQLEPMARHSDLAVKYTSWTIAFILPDTAQAGAQALADKLRKAGAQVRPPWDGAGLTLSASVAEAVVRPDYDNEDIVTELINRAQTGLDEAEQRGGDASISLKIPAN